LKKEESIVDFRKKLLEEKIYYSNLYKEYKSAYIKKKLNLQEYCSSFEEKKLFLFYTISNSKISYFEDAAKIHLCSKTSLINQINMIKDILKKKKINKYSFEICIDKNEIDSQLLYKINPKLLFETQYISLESLEEDILKNFKSNCRYDLKKILRDKNFTYEIIEKNNFKKDKIFEMMNAHTKVSGRMTRPLETWLINEKMILSGEAFIVVIYYKTQAISFSLFTHNKFMTEYFSSVTFREFFKLGGINNLTLWLALIFSKKIKIKKFYLGITKYIQVRDDTVIDEKQKKITFFKSRFNGLKEYKIIVDEKSNI